jgi:hypothetical protein
MGKYLLVAAVVAEAPIGDGDVVVPPYPKVDSLVSSNSALLIMAHPCTEAQKLKHQIKLQQKRELVLAD